jgi:hypothetical protein
MKGLYFAIPAGLLLATVAVLAQDKPGADKHWVKDKEQLKDKNGFFPADKGPPPPSIWGSVDPKQESLDQLVAKLRNVRAQKQALEKQDKELVDAIRIKVQEQKKALQVIERLCLPEEVKEEAKR